MLSYDMEIFISHMIMQYGESTWT